jgi:nucleoside-diphosphate-sugar epimerase
VYNAADDTAVTWQQYFSDLARAAHAPPPRAIPRGLALVAAHLMERTWRALRRPERPQLTLEAYNLVGADLHIPSDRARAELGYVPLVDYPAGLRQVTAYIAANPALFAPG